MSLWYLRRDGVDRRKLIEAETAEEAVLACGDEEDVILAGAEVWFALFELDREPGDFEGVDEETGAIVLRDAAGADAFFQRQVDEAAGAFRCRFITDVPGQELTYLRKETEARDHLAGGEGPWAMLEAEADATGKMLSDLAREVVARADDWLAIGARIEAQRQAAKQEVAAADTEAGKRAAAIVDWGALISAP